MTAATINISLQDARRIALQSQDIHNRKSNRGKSAVKRTIESLGYIQIDTISVIERAHHHTFWNRTADYSHHFLHQLQWEDRAIFEYWGHAASFLPMKDYRYYLPTMKRFRNPKHEWVHSRLEKYGALMPEVLKQIREEGPLGARDFKNPPGKKRGAWWDWKPAKAALELLYWQGELMVSERNNFSKIYDLRERVLPAGLDVSFPDEMELGIFLVNRALQSYGIATEKEIREHIHAAEKTVITRVVGKMLVNSELQIVKIDGSENQQYYALRSLIKPPPGPVMDPETVLFLSPFDNLIIQRDRLVRLFNFDYALECYVPQPKRKFGYFVLPILWQDNFIGRMDAKAERKVKILIVRNLVFEPEFTRIQEVLPCLAAGLKSFAEFNGCDSIQLETIKPLGHKAVLKSLIRKL
ncbi:MAG: YcaQ family DNA glycosylase [FCB group bacterium]|nr:YcaQ family DNA glycosylase [FCB group bacterium]